MLFDVGWLWISFDCPSAVLLYQINLASLLINNAWVLTSHRPTDDPTPDTWIRVSEKSHVGRHMTYLYIKFLLHSGFLPVFCCCCWERSVLFFKKTQSTLIKNYWGEKDQQFTLLKLFNWLLPDVYIKTSWWFAAALILDFMKAFSDCLPLFSVRCCSRQWVHLKNEAQLSLL